MTHPGFLRAAALVPVVLCFARGAVAQIIVPEEDVLFPADADAEDHFGFSVDVSGDTLVVGSRQDDPACAMDRSCNSGSAYVFVRTLSGWVQQQKITPVDGAAGDDFGESVAISGETLVVGAPGVDDVANNCGAVYVFTRSGTQWFPQGARLIGSAAAAEDALGASVDLHDDLLVSGARLHDGVNLFNCGNAYVWTRSGTTWTEEAELEALDMDAFDLFGSSVAAYDDRVVVGSPMDDDNGPSSGSAYVFVQSGTTWTQEEKLVAGDGFDQFGDALSFSGTSLAVGAPFGDRSTTNPGTAYVFTRSGTVWSQQAMLLAGDLFGSDRFGDAVALDGDRLLVGAPADNHVGSSSGSAYVFERSGTAWTQEAKLVPSDGDALDEFGFSVGLDGTRVAVGAWANDDVDGPDQGSAYAFLVKEGTLPQFCAGDGGDQMGCTDCPCSNNAPVGTLGGCLNSAGRSGRLGGFGVPSVMSDTLRFECLGCLPSSFGLLISADNALPAMGPCPPGSGLAQPALLDGLRCAGVNLIRHGTRATDANGNVGITNNGWGPPSGPPGGIILQGGFGAGQTRFFQVFYREDELLGCTTGVNTSNGIEVLFVN